MPNDPRSNTFEDTDVQAQRQARVTEMGRLGFEPRTNRLKAEYSTVELATRADSFTNAQLIMLTQAKYFLQALSG